MKAITAHAILEALRNGPLPHDELARRLDASTERVCTVLSRLLKSGRVQRVKKASPGRYGTPGIWRLP